MGITKPKTWLLIPYGFLSMLLIIAVVVFAGDWLDQQWMWLSLLILVPVALLENLKSGHSAMKVMSWKVFWTLMSFFMAGGFMGYIVGRQNYGSEIPWYFILAIGLILVIEFANIYTLLKSVKREFGSFN